jgi:hypothetical protein
MRSNLPNEKGASSPFLPSKEQFMVLIQTTNNNKDQQRWKMDIRLVLKNSEFQFLPPNFTLMTIFTPFNKIFSHLPHLVKFCATFYPVQTLNYYIK